MTKVKEKKLILDLRGALLTLERRGTKLTGHELAKKYGAGLAYHSLLNYDKKAPPIVATLYGLVKSGIPYSDAVKDIAITSCLTPKREQVINYITNMCEGTGLTFEELVKEV